MDLSNFPWHDAILKEIKIDRSNPGYKDEIEIQVIWPNSSQSKFIFRNSYFAKFDLNFGIIADEAIYEVATISVADHEVQQFIKKWREHVPDIIKLNFIEILTISTGSRIRIFCKEIVEVNL